MTKYVTIAIKGVFFVAAVLMLIGLPNGLSIEQDAHGIFSRFIAAGTCAWYIWRVLTQLGWTESSLFRLLFMTVLAIFAILSVVWDESYMMAGMFMIAFVSVYFIHCRKQDSSTYQV